MTVDRSGSRDRGVRFFTTGTPHRRSPLVRVRNASSGVPGPSNIRATIHRVLARHGRSMSYTAGGGRRRPRAGICPKARGKPSSTLDFFEHLKIAGGPLVSVLTATRLHGALADTWIMERRGAQPTLEALLELPHQSMPGPQSARPIPGGACVGCAQAHGVVAILSSVTTGPACRTRSVASEPRTASMRRVSRSGQGRW